MVSVTSYARSHQHVAYMFLEHHIYVVYAVKPKVLLNSCMLLVGLALPDNATVRYFARLFLRTGNGSSGLRSAHPLLPSRTPLRGENVSVGIVGQSTDYSPGTMDYADSKRS
jgi:hypothetical protein